MTSISLQENNLALNFTELSQPGGRESNQDAIGHAHHHGLNCFVVSDGAGGHEGGEIASRTVVESILKHFAENPVFNSQAVTKYVEQAAEEVEQRKAQETRLKDMSATVAVLVIDQNTRLGLLCHLGDTRIYLFRRGRVRSVTRDHSVAQQFVDAGFWEKDRLREHPQRSKLLGAIGAKGMEQPIVTNQPVPLQDGDAILMCTDGFWEWIGEEDMEQMLTESTSAHEWLYHMKTAVEANGAAAPRTNDNFSAYAIWLGEPELITIIR